MLATQRKLLEAMKRVDGFFAANPEDAERLLTQAARDRFTVCYARLASDVAAQNDTMNAVSGRVARNRALRTALIENHMRPIARVAELLAPSVPSLTTPVLNAGRKPYTVLIEAARGLAREAATHRVRLMAAGCPEGFVEHLVAAIDTLEEATGEKDQTKARRTGATAELEKGARDARKVLSVLDALLRPHLHDNPSLLAQWETASRIEPVIPASARQKALGAGQSLPALPAPSPEPAVLPAAREQQALPHAGVVALPLPSQSSPAENVLHLTVVVSGSTDEAAPRREQPRRRGLKTLLRAFSRESNTTEGPPTDEAAKS